MSEKVRIRDIYYQQPCALTTARVGGWSSPKAVTIPSAHTYSSKAKIKAKGKAVGFFHLHGISYVKYTRALDEMMQIV